MPERRDEPTVDEVLIRFFDALALAQKLTNERDRAAFVSRSLGGYAKAFGPELVLREAEALLEPR
jgi:hypothetical protein